MRKFLPPLLAFCVIGAVVYLFQGPKLPAPDLPRSAPLRASLESGGPVTLLAIGDSITAGMNSPYTYLSRLGVEIRARYPDADLRLVNSGVPGDTAAGGLQRIERDVLAHDADMVFIAFGWNDTKLSVPPEDFEQALRAMVRRILDESRGVPYLMTPPHVNVTGSAWKAGPRIQAVRDLAGELDCGLVDLDRHFRIAREEGVDLEELLSDDQVHPSGLGQDLIAMAILREIVP